MTVSDSIKAGEKAAWSGAIKYNQFIANHQNLRNAEMENMKVVWLPESVLFEEGTTMGASDGAK